MGVGQYVGTLAGAFPVGNVFIPMFGNAGGATMIPIALSTPAEYFYSVIPGSDGNTILLQVYDAAYDFAELSSLLGSDQSLPVDLKVF
jgi:hypothetical protein